MIVWFSQRILGQKDLLGRAHLSVTLLYTTRVAQVLYYHYYMLVSIITFYRRLQNLTSYLMMLWWRSSPLYPNIDFSNSYITPICSNLNYIPSNYVVNSCLHQSYDFTWIIVIVFYVFPICFKLHPFPILMAVCTKHTPNKSNATFPH